MALYTKCILSPIYLPGGAHISVMSRHTRNDGETKDERITPLQYDYHLAVFAPPPKLVGNYYRREIDWNDFLSRYLEYLREKRNEEVRELAQRVLKESLTLLCIEVRADMCHRRLLAEECQRYQPSIKIVHL